MPAKNYHPSQSRASQGGHDTPKLEVISAPYNFVPLSDWVHCPDWADKVSHDIPFRDGISGHLDLKIKAVTPVLVGREQQKASDDAPGRVEPFRLPDGRYALPGTALKGMIRNVIEIASFSRMAAVDDVRYGVRDLTPAARSFYGNHMTTDMGGRTYRALSRAGWLFLDPDRKCWMIQPCLYARVEQHDLDRYAGSNWFNSKQSQRKTAKEKYEAWSKSLVLNFTPGDEQPHRHSDGKRLVYRKATDLGKGTTKGTLVFTGQPSPRKHMEFIFYGTAGDLIPVPDDVFRGFLDIHDQKGELDSATAWGFWKAKDRVPVFFLPDNGNAGTVGSLGLAMMYKLAYRHSIHDAIRHTSTMHLESGMDDLATILFGRVGETPEQCLKGRVTFHHASAEGKPVPQAMKPTILNGPKPTYYPNYIRQSEVQGGQIPKNKGYATLMDKECQIRGWKRYPARPYAEVQPLTGEQAGNPKVQVVLNPLPANTVFNSRVSFHNLLPEELGALCWALTWGGAEGLHHSLGMGKPFGYGQLAVEISGAEIIPNRPDADAPTWEMAREAFIAHMDDQHRKAKSSKWQTSPQIQALLGMADPDKASLFKGELRHMRLTTDEDNEFKDAKMARLALVEYPRREHPETMTEREAVRKAEAARRREEERLAQMTEQDRKIEELDRLFSVTQTLEEKSPGSPLGQRFNSIIEEAKAWSREDKDQLIPLLDKINKYMEGNAKKRRGRIDALRTDQEGE